MGAVTVVDPTVIVIEVPAKPAVVGSGSAVTSGVGKARRYIAGGINDAGE